MPRAISETNTYTDKLIKLIPTEWVGAYVALKGILDSRQVVAHEAYYTVILLLLILLPFYLHGALRVRSPRQIVVTTISFLVWVLTLGGDYLGAIPFYEPYQASIVLVFWTLLVPILGGGRGEPPRARRRRTGKDPHTAPGARGRILTDSHGTDAPIGGTPQLL